MASQHRLITAAGVTIWFNTPAVVYSGTGTPWTTQGNSPFQIAMNQVTGPIWTPQAPTPNTVFGGGGPFRHGSSPVYNSYGNVEEDIPIQIRATSHNNAVAALRLLRIELQQALYLGPLIFVFQPDGATNAVMYEISSASIQENAISLNQEAKTNTFRAVIHIVRQPLGGGTALTTPINNVTVVNNSTSGSNVNLVSLNTLTGDMVNEGTPLNVKLGELSVTAATTRLLLATATARTTFTGSGSAKTTSSTTATSAVSYSFTAAAAQSNPALKPRFLVRQTSQSANCEIRIRVITGSVATGYTTIYVSPWVGRVSSAGVGLIDFGSWSFDYLRVLGITTTDFQVLIEQRSTNGSSASFNEDYVELLLYYDFMQVDLPATSTTATIFNVEGLRKTTNGPYLPRYPVVAYSSAAAGAPGIICAPPRGRLRAFAGCSLWVAWYFSFTDYAHAKADTMKLTASFAPLYMTVRGAG